VINQPAALLVAPEGKALTLLLVPLGVLLQQSLSEGLRTPIRQGRIQSIRITASGKGIAISRLQQPISHQLIGIQQPGVQREAARGAVGRAERIGGRQGQQLPGLDAVIGQEIKPAVGHCSEAAAGRGAG
jgi:hypothetical protein